MEQDGTGSLVVSSYRGQSRKERKDVEDRPCRGWMDVQAEDNVTMRKEVVQRKRVGS